ncbi:VOC family protein [Humibacter ginsenosidimutans]|uniref:Methylmalonyl-CoA epimerase n=1 Tax=Humibacter ginsenosidimutans TaxID=2599293 RepID=A0A5B8M6J9_9MICO|nr:VOC family protein [Humibacter ginsenosidimutans]QDZ15624.1 methylmalonyl-CoA epimerase [Humibacter ginsenosidimutans]
MEIGQVVLHVDDLKRATAFYESFTGTPPVFQVAPEGPVYFQLEGVRLVLDPAAPSSALFHVKARDIHATTERLRAQGVPVVTEPHVYFERVDAAAGPAGTVEWHALLRDSEGNLVGLIEHQPARTST